MVTLFFFLRCCTSMYLVALPLCMPSLCHLLYSTQAPHSQPTVDTVDVVTRAYNNSLYSSASKCMTVVQISAIFGEFFFFSLVGQYTIQLFFKIILIYVSFSFKVSSFPLWWHSTWELFIWLPFVLDNFKSLQVLNILFYQGLKLIENQINKPFPSKLS